MLRLGLRSLIPLHNHFGLVRTRFYNVNEIGIMAKNGPLLRVLKIQYANFILILH